MKLPIADTHDRDTIPCISLNDPGNEDPTEPMFREQIASALAACRRASERAVKVASSSKMKVGR